MPYQTKKLGEICEIVTGSTPRTSIADYYGGNILWAGPTDLDQGDYITDTQKKLTRRGVTEGGARLVPKDSVMVSCIGNIGKVAIASKEMTTNQQINTFYPKVKDLDSKYLFYALIFKSDEFRKLSSQTTLPIINKTKCSNIEIPLPPLPEQKKIVAKLERVLAKISEAKKLRAEAREAAQNLLPAELHKILSQQHSNILQNVGMSSSGKKSWEEKEINDICEHPQYGFTASSTREQVGPKFLRITDIQEGKVNWETVPYCKCLDPDKYKLAKGDIVFARTGATVGKSYLITEVPRRTIYASYLIRLRVKDKVIPEFLYYFFQSHEYWEQITNEQVGMAQPNVNGSKLAKIKIPLPPLAEQKKIVARLDSLSEKIGKIKNLQSATQNDFTALEQSVLSEVFTVKQHSNILQNVGML